MRKFKKKKKKIKIKIKTNDARESTIYQLLSISYLSYRKLFISVLAVEMQHHKYTGNKDHGKVFTFGQMLQTKT
jgi:hypothetical protein